MQGFLTGQSGQFWPLGIRVRSLTCVTGKKKTRRSCFPERTEGRKSSLIFSSAGAAIVVFCCQPPMEKHLAVDTGPGCVLLVCAALIHTDRLILLTKPQTVGCDQRNECQPLPAWSRWKNTVSLCRTSPNKIFDDGICAKLDKGQK